MKTKKELAEREQRDYDFDMLLDSDDDLMDVTL